MYIKKIEELNINVKDRADKQNPTKHKGLNSHLYGVEMEKEISNFLKTTEGEKVLKVMNLKPNEVQNIVYGKELSSYTKNKKIDILIITKNNKDNIGISCKTSKAKTVGVLEMHGDTFYKKCKVFLKQNNMSYMESNLSFFPFYDENGRTISAVNKADKKRVDNFRENIQKDWKKLLQFCIQGEDTDEEIDYIFFYDKDEHYLYVSNIKDYLDLVDKYGSASTLNSKFTITSTSDKNKDKTKEDKRIKFKMQNPIKILKAKHLI